MKIFYLSIWAVTLLFANRLTAQPANGLIAWYQLNSDAADASGNGYDGAVNGAVPAVDRFGQAGQAMLFNGDSSFIGVSDAPALRLAETDFTVSAWIFETQRNTNFDDSIITKRSKSSGDGWGFSVRGLRDPVNNGRIWWGRGGTDPFAVSSNIVSLGQWHHVAVVYTIASATLAFYIDGALDSATNGMPSPNPATTRAMHIGNDSAEAYDDAYVFHGSLDDVRLYGRALSALEIQQLFSESVFLNSPSMTGENMVIPVGGIVSGQTVVLQNSTDLIHWSPISTNTANPQIVYSIPINPQIPGLFFRLKQ